MTATTAKRRKAHLMLLSPLIFMMRRSGKHVLEFSSKVVATSLMSLSLTKAPRTLSSREICTNKVVFSHFKLNNAAFSEQLSREVLHFQAPSLHDTVQSLGALRKTVFLLYISS